jgi:hypothetical protein
MNLNRACQLLDISIQDIHGPNLKKQYKRKCLQCHPDKKGDKERFIELKEAYDFVSSQPKPTHFLDEVDETVLRQYLFSIYQLNLNLGLFKHPWFVQYFVDPVEEHLHQYKQYVLNPTLEQLLRKDVYYLEDEKLYIPLWHEEILFDKKIKVILDPVLPEKVRLDENNNLLVMDTQGKDTLVFGSISILIMDKERKEKKIIGKGIPRIQSSLYDASELSDIILL